MGMLERMAARTMAAQAAKVDEAAEQGELSPLALHIIDHLRETASGTPLAGYVGLLSSLLVGRTDNELRESLTQMVDQLTELRDWNCVEAT